MSIAANRYARALMEALYPDKAERGLSQLQAFAALLAEQPEARRIFDNPAFSADRRNALLHEIGDALSLDVVTRNFLRLLVERNRLDLTEKIVAAYQKLLDEKLGVVRASVKSARPLDPEQQAEVARKLQALTGKQVRLDLSVDPSLIGGVVAQVGSTVYDGSVRQQLKAFKNRLVNG